MPSKKTATKKAKATSKKTSKASATKRAKSGSRDLVDHALMHALSHRLRTRILAILNECVSSPNLLSKELNEDLSQVSYHVERLKKLGLIELVKTEPRRGAVEHFYKGVRPILVPKGVWDNLPPSLQDNISVGILRNSFEDADASMNAEIFDDPDSFAGWIPLFVDRVAFRRIDELLNEFLEEIFNVQGEASGRLAESDAEGFSVTVTLGSFLSTRSPEESKRATAARYR